MTEFVRAEIDRTAAIGCFEAEIPDVSAAQYDRLITLLNACISLRFVPESEMREFRAAIREAAAKDPRGTNRSDPPDDKSIDSDDF